MLSRRDRHLVPKRAVRADSDVLEALVPAIGAVKDGTLVDVRNAPRSILKTSSVPLPEYHPIAVAGHDESLHHIGWDRLEHPMCAALPRRPGCRAPSHGESHGGHGLTDHQIPIEGMDCTAHVSWTASALPGSRAVTALLPFREGTRRARPLAGGSGTDPCRGEATGYGVPSTGAKAGGPARRSVSSHVLTAMDGCRSEEPPQV